MNRGRGKSFLLSSVYLSCSSSSYSGTRSGGPVPSIKLHGKKFSYDGYPQGSTGSRVIVKGKLFGKTASGTVQVTDAGYDAVNSSTYFCSSGVHKWTAKRP